jgi:hypothetical protein
VINSGDKCVICQEILVKTVLLAMLLCLTNLCFAAGSIERLDKNTMYPVDYGVSDVITETIALRPLGLIGTVIGSVVFAGTLPFSLFASIAPPHDVYQKAATAFVIAPANATFKRPFAYYRYHPRGEYPTVIE